MDALMRKLSRVAAAAAVALSVTALAPQSGAAEVKMMAKVTEIQLAADGKSATIKLTNAKDGSPVRVTVSDKATLEKLAAKAIAAGDQVRLSYDPAGGSNISKTLKKAEGC
jgi:P pilus assembly chaperone PapD